VGQANQQPELVTGQKTEKSPKNAYLDQGGEKPSNPHPGHTVISSLAAPKAGSRGNGSTEAAGEAD